MKLADLTLMSVLSSVELKMVSLPRNYKTQGGDYEETRTITELNDYMTESSSTVVIVNDDFLIREEWLTMYGNLRLKSESYKRTLSE